MIGACVNGQDQTALHDFVRAVFQERKQEMIQKLLAALIPVLFIINGCAANSVGTQKKYYTKDEHSKMTYCIGMSDTAMYVASEKLKGTPKSQLINYYSGKSNARLNTATVDRVYDDDFTNAWDYTIGFFNECALNLARVPESRVNFASYCAQNTLIADVAHANKKYGYPKERAYQYFDSFESKTPQEIIDKVYSSSKSRAAIKLEIWNDCMVKISDD